VPDSGFTTVSTVPFWYTVSARKPRRLLKKVVVIARGFPYVPT
jgi:hypothetical protein